MRPTCCSHWPPPPCFVTQTCFLPFFLLKLPYPTPDCPYINTLSPHPARIWPMNVDGKNFFCSQELSNGTLNCTSSQPSSSTGTEQELRIAVDSRLCMAEERYCVCMEPLLSSFRYSNKHMMQEAKLFNSSSYIKISNHNKSNSTQIYKTWDKIMVLYILIFQCYYTFLIKYCRY